jgi:hypothetical protein
MDWQFAVGTGLAIIGLVLPFVVKTISPWITWPILGIGILLIIWGGAQWKGQKKEAENTRREQQVFIAQLNELGKVTDLLGGKDEYALRQLFDFPGYVKFGLLRAKQVVDPDKVSAAENEEMERYFQGWIEAAMNPSLVHITQVNGGAPRVEPQPGIPFIFRLPKQYSIAKRQLLPFETSPQMPREIQDAIKDFDQTLDANAHLLITVVKEKLAQDKNNILLEDDPSTPYLGVTLTAYWNRFIPLKAKADDVLAKIRAFLKVN